MREEERWTDTGRSAKEDGWQETSPTPEAWSRWSDFRILSCKIHTRNRRLRPTMRPDCRKSDVQRWKLHWAASSQGQDGWKERPRTRLSGPWIQYPYFPSILQLHPNHLLKFRHRGYGNTWQDHWPGCPRYHLSCKASRLPWFLTLESTQIEKHSIKVLDGVHSEEAESIRSDAI